MNPHTYQGAIAVNAEGAAYITFTRSGSSTSNGWPSLVRARLTADYSGIQYEDSMSSEQGPGAWLGPDSSGNPVGTLGWAYADMQAAVDHCGYWAVGTLVADPGDSTIAPHDKRAIWLTEILPDCGNNAEMNGDGAVDAADLALFLDHYAKGAPQADMDGDSTVDAIDSIIYSDQYAKR